MLLRHIYTALALWGVLLGCTHLDVSPDASLDIDINAEDKIAELLTAAYPSASYFAFLEARTDNVGERPHGTHYRLNEAMYYWEDYDQEDLDTPLAYWNACYRGIAQVNKALDLLKDYPKTPRVKALYGEAFLLRAYLHFMLVNIWCEPYRGSGTSAPGIPYMTRPERHALVDYSRGTVSEVYDNIERDLKFGISLVDDTYYKHPRFHFNKRAAYAFASRYYLHRGDWALVIRYADYALGTNPGAALRVWRQDYEYGKFGAHLLHQEYLAPTSPANLLLATTESRLARDIQTQQYGPTVERMVSLFDKHGIEGCSEARRLNLSSLFRFLQSPAPVRQGLYISKFDERSLSLDNTSSRPRGLYVTNVLLTTDEVMLNRIEAHAMLGQYDRALDDLTVYLQAKYDVTLPCDRASILSASSASYSTITPFYGLTIKQLAMIKILLGFRQCEFYQEGLRWLDIRRFYLPVTRESRSSLYRPLQKEDPRKLLQIPSEAIKRGLTPNPR